MPPRCPRRRFDRIRRRVFGLESHPPTGRVRLTTSTVAPVATSTTSTLPPAPSSTSVSNENGVVTIKGRGDRTVALPAAVRAARHRARPPRRNGSFAVIGVDSLADSAPPCSRAHSASYDGTFPVGFVDRGRQPDREPAHRHARTLADRHRERVLAPPLGRGVRASATPSSPTGTRRDRAPHLSGPVDPDRERVRERRPDPTRGHEGPVRRPDLPGHGARVHHRHDDRKMVDEH